MSLDVHRAVLQDVKNALAAIPSQASPPISPIPDSRLYYNRRPSGPLDLTGGGHAWLRSEGTFTGRAPLRIEYTSLLMFDAWGRNREEIEAIRKAVMGAIDGAKKPHQGSAYAITYSLNSSNVITEEDALHLSLIFSATYLESAVIA